MRRPPRSYKITYCLLHWKFSSAVPSQQINDMTTLQSADGKYSYRDGRSHRQSIILFEMSDSWQWSFPRFLIFYHCSMFIGSMLCSHGMLSLRLPYVFSSAYSAIFFSSTELFTWRTDTESSVNVSKQVNGLLTYLPSARSGTNRSATINTVCK